MARPCFKNDPFRTLLFAVFCPHLRRKLLADVDFYFSQARPEPLL